VPKKARENVTNPFYHRPGPASEESALDQKKCTEIPPKPDEPSRMALSPLMTHGPTEPGKAEKEKHKKDHHEDRSQLRENIAPSRAKVSQK